MHSRRTHSIELRHISEALMLSGHTSLDEQAKALGVHRSTAWTIVKNKHKLGRLSAKTVDRILSNPQTPPAVRAIVQQYVVERSKQNSVFSQKISSVGTKRGLRLV
jgi:plasmid maintenance system antidote protein VapI